MIRALFATSVLLLTGCANAPRPGTPPVASTWRTRITEADHQRLRNWRTAFTRGLAEARAAGHAVAITREGSILEPDAAIGGGIPNGDYRCRVIKLGAKRPGLLPFITYPSFNCRIAPFGRRQSFTKLTGSQRQVGTIYPHDQVRSVFLGTLVLGDEPRALAYGADPERDLAGWVERVAPSQWRLLLPSPRFESLIDVVELVPAP